MKNTQPITWTRVRPLRVLSAIAAYTVLLMATIFFCSFEDMQPFSLAFTTYPS
jgi:hypothetical protein